jgi:hypothetical protein
MPGWQITLITVGAALVAATTAVLFDQARAARRQVTTAAAWTMHAGETVPRRR